MTGSKDNTAEIWDAETGQEISTLKGHSHWVRGVAFSPDGKRVLTGSEDRTAKIWDAESGREILTLRGHSRGVRSVAFCPDGKRVVTGSMDSTAKVWDAETGQEILSLKGRLASVVSVAFSPDGGRVVTGAFDSAAKLWDAETGREILSLRGHPSHVSSVAFSADGKRVVTGSGDKTAKVWDAFDWSLSREELARQKRERYRRWFRRMRAETRPGARPTAAPAESTSTAPVPAEEPAAESEVQVDTVSEAPGKGKVLAYDGFDGELSLDWEILNPDPTHFSLDKLPGTLTVTTQEGGFARDSTDYKNLFLIGSPAAGGEDFQLTACISSFKPVADWNQAGMIFHNDDDNYLKFVYQWNSWLGGPGFTIGVETEGRFSNVNFRAHRELERVWLRVAKRGNHYTFSTSLDGERFLPRTYSEWDVRGGFEGDVPWGDESVKHVGLFAKNATESAAPEIDASFDFFEVRSLPGETQIAEEEISANGEGI